MNIDFLYYLLNSLTSNQIVGFSIFIFIFLLAIILGIQSNSQLNAITFIPKKTSDQKFIIKETQDKTFTLQIKRVFLGISYLTYFHRSEEGIHDNDDYFITYFKTRESARKESVNLSEMASYKGDRIVEVI